MPPDVASHPLTRRLAAVRRRLRLVAGLRGVSWLVTTVVLTLALVGLLDWWAHLPGIVRAVFLGGLLSAAGLVVYRFLVRPLRERSDDLSLALRIEAQFPELNDALASTVQFLAEPEAVDRSGSTALRKAAVHSALKQAEQCDFNRVIDRCGIRVAGVSLVLSSAAGIALVMLYPAIAWTAIARLADPFGSEEWPAQTRFSELTARSRLARGDLFELRGTLEGVIPDKATVSFWFDGSPPADQSVAIVRKDNGTSGSLVARLEPSRVQRGFRYRVRANDALTPWHEVVVLPPPGLVPLGGRPSPLLDLSFPEYTDLKPQSLPDGAATIAPLGNAGINGALVAGSRLRLRARVDRPIARAWIEYQPESRARDDGRPSSPLKVAAFLGPLGARGALDGSGLLTGGQRVWGQVPVKLTEGIHADVTFIPWIGGDYALCLEDDIGIRGYWSFNVPVQSDPAPLVDLKRPSASRDSLLLLPQAEVAVQALVNDEHYAIREVFLDYRCKDEKPQRRLLYHHQAAGAAVAGVAGVPAADVRLRPQQLTAEYRLPLKQVLHADGRPLKEGDTVILSVAADDFDNVAVDKKPGRSHEVELRIVGRPLLEAVLNQAQAQVQQELLKLREQERDAIKKVADAEKQWRHTGKLREQDVENLAQARSMQEQVKARIGTPEEGLRAEVNKALQTMRDNQLPRSETQQRLEMVAEELERLAREELAPIEPLLTDARRENELATEHKKPEKGQRGLLNEALDHQEEVEKTLSSLLKEMEPGSTTREVKSEARALLEEERKLAEQTNKLLREMPVGDDPKTLRPEQAADLERAAEWQARLAEHMDELLNKMARVAEDKNKRAQAKQKLAEEKEKDADKAHAEAEKVSRNNLEKAREKLEEEQQLKKEAEQLKEEVQTLKDEAAILREAARQGRKDAAVEKMKKATQEIGQNQIGKARENQREGKQALEEVIKALEQRREEELDQLIKKMKEAEKEMARLAEEQEKLQKKVKDAQKIEDAQERSQELQRLAREQKKLREQAEEVTRRLTRLRAERAREALGRAGGQMGEAGQQLERGKEAEDQQDEALDRLDEARQELENARKQAEEELAREKLAKVADQIRRLKERQEQQPLEAERIQRVVLDKKGWKNNRDLLRSLAGMADAQELLAKETRTLAEGKLKDALVFTRTLSKSADAMDKAASSIRKRFQRVKDNPDSPFDADAEETADREAQAHMRLALQRLEQLLDALKEEKGGIAGGKPQGGQGPMGGNKGDAVGIPQLAQLKALKALQEEVNQRTEEFSKKHPDAAKLTEKGKTELETLRLDQAEVADLFNKLTSPADEGGKP